jgi:hypothetical protein
MFNNKIIADGRNKIIVGLIIERYDYDALLMYNSINIARMEYLQLVFLIMLENG